MSNVHVETIEVTPALAGEWLSKNDRNRNLRQELVFKYAKDMIEGRWGFTGDPVQFDVNGNLLNGQHRMAAIIKANVTLRMLVVRGLNRDSQEYMDVGARRTLGDQLQLMGFKNSRNLAASARLTFEWNAVYGTDRAINRHSTASEAVLREFIEKTPILVETTAIGGHFQSQDLGIPTSVVSAASWGIVEKGGHDLAVAVSFFEALALRTCRGNGDPKLALLQRISRASMQQVRLLQTELLYMVVRVFNADRLGESLQKIQISARGVMGRGIVIPAVASSWR